MAAHAAESAESAKRIAIGQTFVPSHLRREESVLTAMPSGKDHYSRDHVRYIFPMVIRVLAPHKHISGDLEFLD